MRVRQMFDGVKQAPTVGAIDTIGRSFAAYLAGFGVVTLAVILVESLRDARVDFLSSVLFGVAIGAVFGLIHLICLGLLTLPLEWARRRKFSDSLYRRLILLTSLLIGAAFPTALSLLLLSWQTGHDFNFAGHSITLASLYRNWLFTLIPCLVGAYFAGRQWSKP